MDLFGPTTKRARVGLGGSTLPATQACPPSQHPEPKPFPKHPSRPPSQQFAEVVVGSSVQQVQEDSDDNEEGQDEQQQVESVPSQQQGQQDR